MPTSPSDHAVATDVATRAGEVLLKLRADVGETAHDWWSLRDEGDWSAHQFIVEARPGDGIETARPPPAQAPRFGVQVYW